MGGASACLTHEVVTLWYRAADLQPLSPSYNPLATRRRALTLLATHHDLHPLATRLSPSATPLRYRAPEVLLGATHYEGSIDGWSMGAVLAELATGQPLLPGDSEIGQLVRTSRLLTPAPT